MVVLHKAALVLEVSVMVCEVCVTAEHSRDVRAKLAPLGLKGLS